MYQFCTADPAEHLHFFAFFPPKLREFPTSLTFDPVALLTLKATGTCQVTIPEWLYNRDCPGHYMRRIKNVALSIPSVVGPYASVNCTLSLLKSTLRKSPIPGDDYRRQGSEDDRFVDYIGAVQSIVTSSGQNDSGMFEANLHDERFLPFEGAGAESTWKLDLPKDYPAFDYATISDVILHIRYTARQGVKPDTVTKALNELFKEVSGANLALLFSLPHDFPMEWFAFVNGAPAPVFSATIRKDHFPYLAQGKPINVSGLELYGDAQGKHQSVTFTGDFSDSTNLPFTLESPLLSLRRNAQVFLVVKYSLG